MRVAVAMSGGVDSSLAAVLLKKEGYDLVGITAKILLCADMDGTAARYDVCCSPENIHDAKMIARENGFPHVVLDVEEDFSREVIDPFCREYLRGRTPSPCILCNARIKFPRLIDFAHTMGCDRLATGHYARIGHTEDDRYYVSASADAEKDQSYFLFSLTQDVLRETLFPLGGYRKVEIRSMAREYGLPVAEKPESQEICFVQDNDYPRYIERRSGIVPPPGDILGADGRVLGRHRGIHRYTIGQRRGLGIAAPEPLYVVEIDPERNVLIAGRKEELARRGFFAAPLSYMKTRSLRGEAFTKTRSMQNPVPVSLEERDGGVYAYFNAPQIGITPGQASVFYTAGGDILGGGWIVKSLK